MRGADLEQIVRTVCFHRSKDCCRSIHPDNNGRQRLELNRSSVQRKPALIRGRDSSDPCFIVICKHCTTGQILSQRKRFCFIVSVNKNIIDACSVCRFVLVTDHQIGRHHFRRLDQSDIGIHHALVTQTESIRGLSKLNKPCCIIFGRVLYREVHFIRYFRPVEHIDCIR
ncbi:hypothetical protein D3C75_728780 [compost metagenome]